MPEPETVALIGSTAAQEWAALLLRRSGLRLALLTRGGRSWQTSFPWGGGSTRSAPSLATALDEVDALAVLLDADDEKARSLVPELQDAGDVRLVLLSSFGLGRDAPRGSDLAIAAACGLMHVTGASRDEERRPRRLHPRQTETLAGSFAATAVLAALLRPDVSVTELGKLEVAAYCTTNEAMKWTHSARIPSRGGEPSYQPCEILPAGDGDVFVQCLLEPQWERFVEAMGDPEWASWPAFATRTLRKDSWAALRPLLVEWLASRSRSEVMELALEHRLPFNECLRPDEVTNLQRRLSGDAAVEQWVYRDSQPTVPGKRPWRPADGAAPLAGTLVLDLSSVWAGPFSARLLGHLGARVIKVESRSRLDDSRLFLGEQDELLPDWPEHDRKGTFNESNQGKEGITLNLTTPVGQELCRQLAERADVVVSNHPVGLLERMGLAPEDLWARNPGLVIARLTAYEPTSPLARLPAYGNGLILQCGFGFAGPGEPWVDQSIPYPDPHAGAMLAYAIVDALRARSRAGRGAVIEASLFGACAAIHAVFGDDAPTTDTGLTLPGPALEGCVPTRDGEWLAITCPDDEAVRRLGDALRIQIPSYTLSMDITDLVGDRTSNWDGQELEALLRRHGIIAHRVVDARRQFRELGLVERDFYRLVDGDLHLHSASPWIVDGTRLGMPRRAPRLGEHTREVLSELLRLPTEQVSELEAAKIAW